MTAEACKKAIEKTLSEKRYHHSLCVARAAVSLAEKYGADPQRAELAGLLHDIMKDVPPQEQLKSMDRFGIMMTALERSAPKLWHAMLGEAYLEQALGVGDRAVLDAVRYHTTGRAGMSLLEKTVFLADFISDDRTYPGVGEMRRLAEESLDGAILEGIAFTVGELAEKRGVIHPDTIAAYNSILLERYARGESRGIPEKGRGQIL